MGFMIQECSYPGALNPEIAMPRLQDPANVAFLAERGIKNPKQCLGMLKKGQTIELADGTLTPADVLGPEKQGRKIVILGDTSDSSAMARLSYGCDVLVHEATNAFIPEEDRALVEGLQKEESVNQPPKGQPWPEPTEKVLHLATEAVLAKTIEHGHSTPHMAGQFGKDVAARQLCLTHFSSRYKGDDAEESLALMAQIAGQARETFGEGGEVHTARDFWTMPLPVKKDAAARIREADDIEGSIAALSVARLSSKRFVERAREARGHTSIRNAMNRGLMAKVETHH